MKRYIIILFIIFPFFLTGQNFSLNRGIPFVKNFSQSEYHAHEQNFDIVQDTMGIMYFANFEAVLIYDGSNWTKIPTNSGMRVLDLDICCKGNVFVGGLYDFGYLKRNNLGEFSYHSIADTVYDENQIGEIFSVISLDETVYFINKNRMFVYENNQVEIIEFQKEVVNAFKSNGQLFVFFKFNISNIQSLYNGLTIYKNGAFEKITDNTVEKLTGAVNAFYLQNDSYILGTENQGFFKLQNNIITEFDVPVDIFVKKNTVTSGVKISDDFYAIGTLTQGVLLINSSGEIIQTINKQSSLKDEAVNDIFLDYAGNLWIATNNGISLIEINNALSGIFNENSGIDGKINKIINFNSSLFLSTNYGLYTFADNSFLKVQNFDVSCWDMIVNNDNQLMLATPQGIFIYENERIYSTNISEFSFSIASNDENVFIGQNTKLLIVQKRSGAFVVTDTVSGLLGSVVSMYPTQNYCYAEMTSGKIYKINLLNLNVEEIKTGSDFISLHLNTFKNQIFFTSEKGSFIEKNDVDTIVPFQIVEGNNQSSQIWLYEIFNIKDNLYAFTDGSRKNASFFNVLTNGYTISQNELLPISDFAVRTWYLNNNNNNLLLGGNDGVILYDYDREYVHKQDFGVFFTRISIVNTDSLINLNNSEIKKIKYSENSLLFQYSASYYPAKGNIYYRYFLEGFDSDSSDWLLINYKEYTNLPSGNYKFYVEAKDQFGNIVEASTYEFKVLVPLSRRWWVILIYIVIAGVLIKLFVDWRIRISEKEKEQLEEIIKERTAEIEKSKAEIEAQRDIEYEQRKQIMSSIHYAKRIQEAVLPAPSILANSLNNNYFIFFKPYELVSGDFFWMKELKNFVAIVAADCTGHGVPGAFMSMLGTSFLNEIVTRRSLDSAAEVLERLRQKVKKSLHQEGKDNEQKDGMDVAMYFLDKEFLTVQYAGAYNPLFIVRKTDEITDEIKDLATDNKRIKIFEDEANPNYTLIELKANRQPIGIYIRELPFDNISFQLIKGDCLYTFSDGYQDQFGGDTGEKFNSRRFKKLFLSIQDNDMKEQHRILDQNFSKWKGDLAQIDDVLVMGIKIDF